MMQSIKFAEVLKQLVVEKYRRNRAALAKEVHISPSAISQYVRGRARNRNDITYLSGRWMV
jgi:predicted transcriptional regulator